MSFEARILDSLRPIFPQLNDRVLTECIRNVQETVGSDPATILPGCIDMLLNRTINEENLTANRSVVPEKDRLFASSLNDQQYKEEGQKIECGCC